MKGPRRRKESIPSLDAEGAAPNVAAAADNFNLPSHDSHGPLVSHHPTTVDKGDRMPDWLTLNPDSSELGAPSDEFFFINKSDPRAYSRRRLVAISYFTRVLRSDPREMGGEKRDMR